MYIEKNTHNTKRPTNPSSQVSERKQENKNYFNNVQNKTSQYAYHQHGYDLSAYTQMVASGIEPEQAIINIEFFYKNLFRLENAETK